MNSAAAAFLLLAVLVAANLPFLTERVLFVMPRRAGSPPKGAWWRVAELAVAYVAVGGIARLLEARSGPVYPQGWEFYAITVCLFLVFAFPGFVYRYLWKHHP